MDREYLGDEKVNVCVHRVRVRIIAKTLRCAIVNLRQL